MSDKFLTESGAEPQKRPPKRRKGGAPVCLVRCGSASVPIYSGITNGKTRYTIAFYRDGRRRRRMFTKLEDAKREAESRRRQYPERQAGEQ